MHFLQIWVLPNRQGLASRYDQKAFPVSEKRGRLRLVGSPNVGDGSILIHQDVAIYDASLARGEKVAHPLAQVTQWLGAGGACPSST